MKKISTLILIITVLVSCKNQSNLSKEFDCKSTTYENLKAYSDFKNNFKLHVPSNWKTSKYYSEIQSEVFTADTIKQLTETFILNTSYTLGTVDLDASFFKKTDSIIVQNNFKMTKSGTVEFQNNPSYYYVLKGTKNGFMFHQFNLIVKKSEVAYFSASVDIYGEENIEDRICKSISIIDKIEFLQ